jgi:hypothetical protein
MQEELGEVLAIPVKQARVQALEDVIRELYNIEVIQISWKRLAWVVLEILSVVLGP